MKRLPQLALASLTLLLASCNRVSPPAAPSGTTAYGLTTSGMLATFGTDNAAASYRTLSISGLASGDTLVSLDYRNTDGRLYAATSNGRLYRIDPQTGAATQDSAAVGQGVVTVDFNPSANRLRVIGTNNMNYRLTLGATPVPSTSPAGTVTPDGIFAYAAGDVNAGKTPELVAAAYTNSFNDSATGSVPAGSTTALYSFDAAQDVLVMHDVGPQFSTLKTVAPLGVNVMAGMVGFDISGMNTAYASVSSGGKTTLYRVNLAASSQALSAVSTLNDVSLRDLALVPASR
ncbi:MAG: DUF4394 domain-containing protein [Deinococcus sp.]|uniref:DUF4394 domain-containing protein n=1 Tax=Deinococcus sp. TaxID=47478 RepID=UPI0026DBBB9F|nr:DUF4394 domain-containing protein [Deinococcus sp.]MDO4246008.1 DUF4394 domain-containing protein [Deinococcus sp.]